MAQSNSDIDTYFSGEKPHSRAQTCVLLQSVSLRLPHCEQIRTRFEHGFSLLNAVIILWDAYTPFERRF